MMKQELKSLVERGGIYYEVLERLNEANEENEGEN
jgi:hypothetical protein